MLNSEFISRYAVKDMPKHEFYVDSVRINAELEVHACDDKKPKELLSKARPNEASIYQKWREERWTPITNPYWNKVLFNSAKVGRAEDWGTTYPDSKVIPESESLRKYLTVNYPYWDSFENWFWNVCYPTMFRDPGGVICVMPLPKKDITNDTEYYRPFTYIYKSCQVIDLRENEYAVLLSEEKSVVTVGKKQCQEGRVLYFITDTQITEARQVGNRDDWKFEYSFNGVEIYDHNIGHLPVFQLGGLLKEFKPGYKLYESFISPCIPHWNEAVMDYSDHQVNKAIHLHPDKWSFATSECPSCRGHGYTTTGENKEKTSCKACLGVGKIQVQTPFGETILKMAEQTGPNNAVAAPTPPKGYINRPMESLQFLKDEYLGDIKEGLAALNMEFVMSIPGDQSGLAKAYDRDPLVSYYEKLGKHIIEGIFVPSIYFIAKWRYSYQLNESAIDAIMPKVNIPKRFDIVISSMLSDSLKAAHEAGMGSAITGPMEIQYARKQFGENSIQAWIAETVGMFDPLAGKKDDEKMVILSNKGCTQDDYILSSKIYSFIKRALVEDDGFKDLDYAGKSAVFSKYVEETKAANTKSIIPMVNANGGTGPVA